MQSFHSAFLAVATAHPSRPLLAIAFAVACVLIPACAFLAAYCAGRILAPRRYTVRATYRDVLPSLADAIAYRLSPRYVLYANRGPFGRRVYTLTIGPLNALAARLSLARSFGRYVYRRTNSRALAVRYALLAARCGIGHAITHAARGLRHLP